MFVQFIPIVRQIHIHRITAILTSMSSSYFTALQEVYYVKIPLLQNQLFQEKPIKIKDVLRFIGQRRNHWSTRYHFPLSFHHRSATLVVVEPSGVENGVSLVGWAIASNRCETNCNGLVGVDKIRNKKTGDVNLGANCGWLQDAASRKFTGGSRGHAGSGASVGCSPALKRGSVRYSR